MTSESNPVHLAPTIDGPLVVIGDLHGAVGALERLLQQLRSQVSDLRDRWIVFVGDFVDRWEDPRGGLDQVLQLLDEHGKVTACMGNHDLAALGALQLIETPTIANWNLRYLADYDSWPTFAAYEVPILEADFRQLAAAVRSIKPYYDPFSSLFANGEVPPHLRQRREETLKSLANILDQLRERLPERHQVFLAGLPWCIEHPQFLVVHAGLLPDQSLASQLEILRARDFQHGRPAWLHEKRLATTPLPADCPVTVVSGHTIVPKVRFLQGGRRILVDTHDGPGTVLSAVLLPEAKVITS